MTRVIFQKVKLGDIANIESGGTPDSGNASYWVNGSINWATLPDLRDKYLLTTQRKITSLGLENSSAKLLPINTIIFSSRATIGEIAITKVVTSTNQGSKNIICDPKKANFEFMYYFLKNKAKAIEQLANGATYKEINKSNLSNIEILLPDLPTQIHIASIISAYDDLIKNNANRIKILEEMTQRLYAEWFVKFKFPGYEKVEMVNGLPSNWKCERIDQVAKVIRGTSYSSEQIDDDYGDYYLVNLKSFNRGGGFRPDGAKYFNGSIKNDQILNKGDIVVAVTDMTTDRAVISRPARIPSISTNKITFSADVVKIAPKKLPFAYTYYSLLDYRFTETTKNKANGANVLHLKPQAISEYKVIIPTNNLLDKFEKACGNTVRLIDKLSEENEKLVKMRDLLIPQLVTGKRLLKDLKDVKIKKNKNNFLDAVLFARAIEQYSQSNFYPTHLRLTKTDYFVHRYLENDPQQRYSEYMFGPYNPKSTYAGGEMLAIKKGYIKRIRGGFKPWNNMGEARKYYLKEASLVKRVVNFLRYKKDEELELMATVDFIIYKFLSQKIKPTASEILNYINNSVVWKQKVGRLLLNENKITNAMQMLREFAKIDLPYPIIK